MTYSFDDLAKFLKERRDERTKLLIELCDGNNYHLDKIKRKENTKDLIAKAVIKFANDLSEALKWIEKVHGDHFKTMQDLIVAKDDSENKTIEAVDSLKTIVQESKADLQTTIGDKVEQSLSECQQVQSEKAPLDWSKISFEKSVTRAISETMKAERIKEKLSEDKKRCFIVHGTKDANVVGNVLEKCGVERKEDTILNLVRIGRESSAPTKVTLKNHFDVQTVLKNKTNLRNLGSPWDKIFITPLRSKEQIETHRKLVEKLKEKIRLDGMTRWAIQGNEIVNKGPYSKSYGLRSRDRHE